MTLGTEAGAGRRAEGRNKSPKQFAAPASLTPQPLPFITFGPPKHETKALVVPFLQDGHLVINDIIAGGGKQGGVRRSLLTRWPS